MFNILLIEDNEIDYRIISKILEKFKSINIFRVTTLKDTQELIKSLKFDIILVDLNLPDSIGINTFYRVKSFIGHKDSDKLNLSIPLIVLSHVNETKTAILAIKEGAVQYILKDQLTKFPIGETILEIIKKNNRSKNLFNKLYDLSIIDETTQIYNKQGLVNKFDEIYKGKKLDNKFIIAIDIENMEKINHDISIFKGDKILLGFAQLLYKNFNYKEVIISRVYSDNFIVLGSIKFLNDLEILEEYCKEKLYLISLELTKKMNYEIILNYSFSFIGNKEIELNKEINNIINKLNVKNEHFSIPSFE